MKIAIIPCSSAKLPSPARAEDMYIGKIHHLIKGYCQTLGINHFLILSAKYGLIELDTVIAPYNALLCSGSIEAKKKALVNNRSKIEGLEFINPRIHLAASIKVVEEKESLGYQIVLALTKEYRLAVPERESILPEYSGLGELEGNLRRGIRGEPFLSTRKITDAEAITLLAEHGSVSEFIVWCRSSGIAMGNDRAARLADKVRGAKTPEVNSPPILAGVFSATPVYSMPYLFEEFTRR